MVFLGATRAMVRQLAGRHGDEQPVMAVDEFDVADDKRVVKGERAERLETARAAWGAEVDANFREMHGDIS